MKITNTATTTLARLGWKDSQGHELPWRYWTKESVQERVELDWLQRQRENRAKHSREKMKQK
jgi:hypothetical protein